MAEADREAIVVNARVIEGLPNAMYRVELETAARSLALVHLAGESSLLRVRPGDGVVVELMPYDRGRGRIVRRR